MIETLMDQIRVRDRQIEQLQRGIDLLQERIREMSKYGTDENDWPLVPVDPAAIPEGYEVVRVGWPVEGETSCTLNCTPHTWKLSQHPVGCVPILIIRPIKPPIQFPANIVPPGWWLRKSPCGGIFISKHRPKMLSYEWYTPGTVYEVPPPIAASLPKEWRELPWEQSLMQQTEGGEG